MRSSARSRLTASRPRRGATPRASTSAGRSSRRSGCACGATAPTTGSRSTSRSISSRSGGSIPAATRASRSRSSPTSAPSTTRRCSVAISSRCCARSWDADGLTCQARLAADTGHAGRPRAPLLLSGRAIRARRIGGHELVLALPAVDFLCQARDRGLLLLDLGFQAQRLGLGPPQLRELALLLVGVVLEPLDDLGLRLELGGEPRDLGAQPLDLGGVVRADLLHGLRGLQVLLERLDDLDLGLDPFLELRDAHLRSGVDLLRDGRGLMAGDRLLVLLDLGRQPVDAFQELVLLGFRRGLVRAQPVEAGLERDVRLVLLPDPLDERLDELLAALHEPLEVLGLAEPPSRFLVAFLRLGEPVLEARDELAALVRDLAQVVRALLLVAQLLLEVRDLLARRRQLGRDRLALLILLLELGLEFLPLLVLRGKLGLHGFELGRELHHARVALFERLLQPLALGAGRLGLGELALELPDARGLLLDARVEPRVAALELGDRALGLLERQGPLALAL